MNDTDKKRLEEIEARMDDTFICGGYMPRGAQDADDIRWMVLHLKDAMERESRVRELHHEMWDQAREDDICDECSTLWPCSTIAILDGGNG